MENYKTHKFVHFFQLDNLYNKISMGNWRTKGLKESLFHISLVKHHFSIITMPTLIFVYPFGYIKFTLPPFSTI